VASLRYRQTWIMSLLYIGTFGSFIGFSFALPLVIKNTFPEFLIDHPFIATYLAGLGFLGALIGSLSRPLGGWLSDRVGGAKVTLAVFVGMAVFTATAIVGVRDRSFVTFFASYMAIFLLAGTGNGSTYKMIPTIFAGIGRAEAAQRGLDPKEVSVEFKRRAAAVIGIAGATARRLSTGSSDRRALSGRGRCGRWRRGRRPVSPSAWFPIWLVILPGQ